MTTDQFNALPIEARRYIEFEQGQLCCGKKIDLNSHYQNYLKMKTETLFTLRTGAISYVDDKTGKGSVLYPIFPDDTDAEVKAKLKLVLRINKVSPEMFALVNVSAIEKLVADKKVVPLKTPIVIVPDEKEIIIVADVKAE